MTRKLLKTAAIVVIALAPVVAAGTAEAHGGFGGGFHAGVFTVAVSGGEVFATAAFAATVSVWWDFWRALPRLLWRLLPQLLRIRLLLSDRIRDHALLPITTGRLGSIAVPRQSPESRPIAGADGARARTHP